MTTETIRDIRKRCRLAMNGIVSANMRQMGLDYKLNFGVSLARIKEIAAHYSPDEILAKELWKEDVRELKILATILYPTDAFSKEMANVWVNDTPNQEIREQLCLNLLQKLDFAIELAMEWSKSDIPRHRATAYWLLSRLIITKKIDNSIRFNTMPYLVEDTYCDNISLRNAALLLLKNLGRTSPIQAHEILEKLAGFEKSSCQLHREIYDSLKFEFEYYFNDNNNPAT